MSFSYRQVALCDPPLSHSATHSLKTLALYYDNFTSPNATYYMLSSESRRACFSPTAAQCAGWCMIGLSEVLWMRRVVTRVTRGRTAGQKLQSTYYSVYLPQVHYQRLDCFHVPKYSRPLGMECFPSFIQMYNLLLGSAGCVQCQAFASSLLTSGLNSLPASFSEAAVAEYIRSANRAAQTPIIMHRV